MSESSELTGPLVKMIRQMGVFTLRMNSGTARKGKYFIRLHEAGTADILCFPHRKPPTWIETKDPTGKTNREQVEAQAAFRDRVQALGHVYVRAKSLDEALEAVR